MGLFGTTNGSFFEAPDWVDKKKKPGFTDQSPVYPDFNLKWFVSWANPWNFFVNSPNFVWFMVALMTYIICPYDLEAAKEITYDGLGKQFIYRSVIDLFIMLTYFGFWSVTLYHLGWGKRKFNPDYVAPPSRMFHNLWYCCLGAIQLAAWECVFMHLYATKKLNYVPDAELFSTPANIARTIGWTLAVPLYRSVHFYFAHRFIHIRCLYKYVHSLHHRNTDIEPFSGLCMHPIEHLYYYSCVGPSLYFTMSPFHAMWNLIHLLISPAASHSGWEDNMQADQFHYLHHKKFECNYGTGGEPLDKLFGTHRTSLDPGVKTYTGGASESELKAEAALNVDQGETKGSGKTSEGKYVPAKRGICNWDTKGGGLSLAKAVPGFQDGIYHLHYIIMFALLANTMLGDPLATGLGGLDASWAVPLPGKLGQYAAITPGVFWGLTVAVGPMVFAMLLLTIFGDKYSMRWPFHKDSIFGSFGFHVGVGTVMVVMPVYHTVAYMFNEPGQSPALFL